ncbi:ribosome-associated translation inhibitor RaiA [bacterium]|nr:ribosome-associated translation inhibitor RaiA [bacterium]
MSVQITGKNMDVGAALQEHIAGGLEERITKFFDRAGEAIVTVSKIGWAFAVDCSVHLPSGVTLQARGEGADAYLAFEQSLTKIEKRVRRYKSRLRSHRPKEVMPAESAAERIILMPQDDETEEVEAVNGDAPAIVAESNTNIRTMTVSMAVMQLELSDSPALMFRNAAHGGLNMVFRRADGNVGWVDPATNG